MTTRKLLGYKPLLRLLTRPPVRFIGYGDALPLPAPENTVAPVVTGTQDVGSLFSCTTGTWTNSPTGYTYQWQRDGVDISGATSSTYTTVTADKGTFLTCDVTASNGAGSNTATSNERGVRYITYGTLGKTTGVTLGTTPYTESAAAIGTAATDRYVLVFIFNTGGQLDDLSSVTVAGETATIISNPDSGPNHGVALAYVPTSVEPGTTADIVVTLASSAGTANVVAWLPIYGLNSTTDYYASVLEDQKTVTSINADVDQHEMAAVIVVGQSGDTTGTVITCGDVDATLHQGDTSNDEEYIGILVSPDREVIDSNYAISYDGASADMSLSVISLAPNGWSSWDHYAAQSGLSWTFTITNLYSTYSGHTGTQSWGSGGLADGATNSGTTTTATDSGTGEIKLDFGSTKSINNLYLACIDSAFDGWGPVYTNGRVIEYSVNDVDWTTLVTLAAHVDGETWKRYTAGVSARYLRISATTFTGLGEFYAN